MQRSEARHTQPQTESRLGALLGITITALCLGCNSEPNQTAAPKESAASAPAQAGTSNQLGRAAGSAESGGASSTSPSEASCAPGCTSLEACEAGRCVGACPEGSVFIPPTGEAGFTMGKGRRGEPDQAHQVVLTQPFCMDETEVTVAAFKRCVEAGACSLPNLRDINSNYREEYNRDNHPINMVDWRHASAYCEFAGKSLPTEAQWEYAASRGDGRLYPWGDTPDPTCENGYADFTPNGSPQSNPAGDWGCHGGGTSEVKAHPKGNVVWEAGPLYDMGGNVWEWTKDCFIPYPAEKVVDPQPSAHPSLNGSCYVYALRGGGWNRSRYALRVSQRAGSKITYKVPGLGFRCVKNPT